MTGRPSEENDLYSDVRELLDEMRLTWFHPHDSRGMNRGLPDLLIIGRRILYRELKSSTGQLSTAQRIVRYRILGAGGDWGLWRPADLVSGRINSELEAIEL